MQRREEKKGLGYRKKKTAISLDFEQPEKKSMSKKSLEEEIYRKAHSSEKHLGELEEEEKTRKTVNRHTPERVCGFC